MSRTDRAFDLVTGLVDAWRAGGLQPPHAGQIARVVKDRTRVELSDFQVQLVACHIKTRIQPSPWWYRLDRERAMEALQLNQQGIGLDKMAERWNIIIPDARKLFHLGCALTGSRIKGKCKWPSTPWEEARAIYLSEVEGIPRAKVGEICGRSVHWVRAVMRPRLAQTPRPRRYRHVTDGSSTASG